MKDFVELGPLPERHADEAMVSRHARQLLAIEPPVTDQEASKLIRCFGTDDCFGLAWTLLHLIETAPSGAPVVAEPTDDDNEWVRLLWDRAHR